MHRTFTFFIFLAAGPLLSGCQCARTKAGANGCCTAAAPLAAPPARVRSGYAPSGEEWFEASVSPNERIAIIEGPGSPMPRLFFDKIARKLVGTLDGEPRGIGGVLWNPDGTAVALEQELGTKSSRPDVYVKSGTGKYERAEFEKPDAAALYEASHDGKRPFRFGDVVTPVKWTGEHTVQFLQAHWEEPAGSSAFPGFKFPVFGASYTVTLRGRRGVPSDVQVHEISDYGVLLKALREGDVMTKAGGGCISAGTQRRGSPTEPVVNLPTLRGQGF